MTDSMKTAFKALKRNQPPPTFKDVVDIGLSNETTFSDIKVFPLKVTDDYRLAGLRPVSEWKAFYHQRYPGFVLISNPFVSGYQKYWAWRCLHEYHKKPSKTNLDLHFELQPEDNVWEKSLNDVGHTRKSLMDKLRWATVGYHHDWDSKVYRKDNYSEFPADLAVLSHYIASAIGCSTFTAEAAIINFYHLDSTLAPHVDNSEFDLEAPLISVSFGQTAIFLVGGTTREEKPMAMYLRSGDIAVMMGPRRLAYHAIPRVLACDRSSVRESFKLPSTDSPNDHLPSHDSPNDHLPSHESTNDSSTHSEDSKRTQDKLSSDNVTIRCEGCDASASSTSDNLHCKDCAALQISKLNADIDSVMMYLTDDVWKPFAQYLDSSRINMNVRQVFKPGQNFSTIHGHSENKTCTHET